MRNFCEFIKENHSYLPELVDTRAAAKERQTNRIIDFIGAVVSPTHDSPAEVDQSLNESRVHNLVNLLDKPHITQKEGEHLERAHNIQSNANRIQAAVNGNPHKHMQRGWKAYQSHIKIGEDPRVTQKSHLQSAMKDMHDYRKKHFGYKSKFKPLKTNTKTGKNSKEFEQTTGLNLMAAGMHGVEGHNSCPNSTQSCREHCLVHATGQNVMLPNINSKIAHHHYAIEHPEEHARIVHAHLLNHIDGVARKNESEKKAGTGITHSASYRPNMFTDYNFRQGHKKIFEHAHDYAAKKGVQFHIYDYTKAPNRQKQPHHPNDTTALSSTGPDIKQNGRVHKESNDHHVADALHAGHVVAAIIHGNPTHLYDHKHDRYYPVVNGDKDDRIGERHKEAGHKVKNGVGIDPKTKRPTGVVSKLDGKGINGDLIRAMKKDGFSHYSTMRNHPEHGPTEVVEINRKHAKS